MFYYCKSKILRFKSKSNITLNKTSSEIKSIQAKLNKAVSNMNTSKDTLSVLRVKTLEKALYSQYYIDRQKDYLLWLDKTNRMDYNQGSRALFAHLKSKTCELENFGAVFDKTGVLSTTLEGSLENWAAFYEDLYSGHKIPKFSNTCCDDRELDQPFTLIEFTNAVKNLKKNKTPGIDHI